MKRKSKTIFTIGIFLFFGIINLGYSLNKENSDEVLLNKVNKYESENYLKNIKILNSQVYPLIISTGGPFLNIVTKNIESGPSTVYGYLGNGKFLASTALDGFDTDSDNYQKANDFQKNMFIWLSENYTRKK